MSYRSYCDLCHESYDSDNLITCRFCDRDFCYHCGDCDNAVCQWCLDKQRHLDPWVRQLVPQQCAGPLVVDNQR